MCVIIIVNDVNKNNADEGVFLRGMKDIISKNVLTHAHTQEEKRTMIV